MKKMACATLALVAFAAPCVANAAVTVFTDQASFLAAISAPGTDTFNDLPNDFASSPLSRTAGAYTYQAAADEGFYAVGTDADRWLSTNTSTDTIQFSNFTGGVFGFGGFFFGTDFSGSFAPGNVNVSVTDLDGTVSELITSTTTSSFRGFVSNSGILSASFVSAPRSGILFPTVNNVTLGGAAATAAVPEPATWALMLVGFGMIGAGMRRRQRQTVRFAF